MLAEIVRRADGVLLTGGDDIHPDLYDPHLPRAVRQTVGATPDGGGRDWRELVLLDEIFRQGKPLLAICRGHQLLNVALGGGLIADIRRQVPGALNHQRMDRADEFVHEVPLTTGSLLAKIVGKRTLGVNSSHHQAVLEPAESLMAVARTRDGIVEAMEFKPDVGAADAVFVECSISSGTVDRTIRRTSGDFSTVCGNLQAETQNMKSKILVVDDDVDLRILLASVLEDYYDVVQANNGAALQKAFSQPQPDVVLLDVVLPDADGLALLPQIKKRWPDTEVIVLTGHGTISMAVEAGRGGAYNFLAKPFENQKLLADVKCAVERKEQNEENNTLRRALETMSGTASPIFRSAAMQDVVRTVERIAPSDVTILITGESGTGKEVIADLIHALSPRSKNKIIKINCAALPRELIESELFGSVKGAFTGAHTDREGLFRQAEGGTLMLDEISEMPVDTQSKLLRVLQDQEVRPVGGKSATRPTAGSSPPPIASPKKPSRKTSCARTFITASAPFRFICRRCANGAMTSCRWPTRS